MSTAAAKIPSFRHHKPTGQAVVTITGRDIYLGKWGKKTSRAEYDRIIGEWLAHGRQLPSLADAELTVTEVVAAYVQFARGYYVKNGRPTDTVAGIRVALRILRQLYGHTLVRDFGPLALQTLQRRMIELGQSRRYINDNIDRIRRCFKWAVSQQLLPVTIHQALTTVPGLRRGRTDARETEPIGPVADSVVDQTLPHLPPVVADMVRFQRLTGCRPSEVCMLRPCDVDRSGDVWQYVPQTHKTEHYGRQRVVFIGPKAQSLLLPYLLRDAEVCCFSPADSENDRSRRRRITRKSPVQPSQRGRRRSVRRRQSGNSYTPASYRRAVSRACEKAFPPPPSADEAQRKAWTNAHRWHPNQLRHSAATEIRAKYGLEAAQTVLGHATANVTQVYAERDFAKAAAIMREVG